MNTDSQIHEVEMQIDVAKQHITRGKALERLLKNKDFKLLIQDGFFKEEAIRLVELKGSPAMQNPENQANILRAMDAIGVLQGYLRQIEGFGEMAAAAMDEHESTLEELRREEG